MKYVLLLSVFAVMFGYPYGAEVLVSIVGLFGLVYYYLAFKLAAGLNTSLISVGDMHQVQSSTLSVFTNGLAVTTLIMETPYAIVGWMAVPWVALTMMTMSMAWLLYFEFIEINPKEDSE